MNLYNALLQARYLQSA